MSNLDNEGYPTEEFLEYIRNFDFEDAVNPNEYLQELEDGWWMPEWGFTLHRPYRGYRKLELHTGGWSGNEDTIQALQDSFFFTMFWEKTYRGGHYYFKIPYIK